MRLQPIANRVVVRPDKAQDQTPGGIILPDNAKERPRQGKVIAAGPGKQDGVELRKCLVRVGQTVLFPACGGNKVEIDGEELLIIADEEILSVIEKE